MNNYSLKTADRLTHLKIVVVALVAGICITSLGIFARAGADYSQTAQSVPVIKATKQITVTSSESSMVR